MEQVAHNHGRSGRNWWRIAGWGLIGLILLLPLVANAPWTASDFVFAGLLLGSVGLGFEMVVRKSSNTAYRLGALIAILGAFLTIWINGAVGMVGSDDNPYNLLFLGVLLVAVVGSVISLFEPAGTARTMFLAAVLQLAVGAAGIASDPRGGVLSTAFATIWIMAGGLFRRAAVDAKSEMGTSRD